MDDGLVASAEAPKFAAREREVKKTESCNERYEEPRPDAVKRERLLAAAITALPRHEAR